MREMIDSPLTGDFECKTRYIILTITEGSEYMRNMIKRFSVAVLLAVMTVMFTSPALALETGMSSDSTIVSFELASTNSDTILVTSDNLINDFNLNYKDDTDSFQRITNVVTFERETSLKLEKAPVNDMFINEVGWTNYRF
jgi:hypothetical protein